MSKEVNGGEIVAQATQALAVMLLDGQHEGISEEAVQRLLGVATKLYAAKRSSGHRVDAFLPDTVTATEVAITASAMLDAVHMELFELDMWISLGRS